VAAIRVLVLPLCQREEETKADIEMTSPRNTHFLPPGHETACWSGVLLRLWYFRLNAFSPLIRQFCLLQCTCLFGQAALLISCLKKESTNYLERQWRTLIFIFETLPTLNESFCGQELHLRAISVTKILVSKSCSIKQGRT